MNAKQLVSFFLFLLTPSILLIADTNPDSLKALLLVEDSSTKRVDILNELSYYFVRRDRSESTQYAETALELSLENQYPKGEAKSILLLGQNELFNGNKKAALKKLDQALSIAKLFQHEDIIADVYHNKGLAYFQMGMYVESLDLYYKAVELNDKLKRSEYLIHNLNNISLAHREMKNYNKALAYLNRVRKLANETQLLQYLGYAEANIGFIYLAQEEYSKAEQLLTQAIKSVTSRKDSLGISIAADLLAQSKWGLNKLEEALNCTQKAQAMALASNYQDGYINACITQAKVLLKQKKYDETIALSLTTLEEVKTFDSNRNAVDLYDNLAKAYFAKNNIEKAYYYQEQLIIMNDSLFSIEKDKLASQMDSRYLARQKELENQLLKTESERDRVTITKQRFYNALLVLAGILLFLLSALLYNSLRTKNADNLKLEAAIQERTKELQAKNKELTHSNAELERLNYVASHDLKQPLVNISSFSTLLKRKLPKNEENNQLHQYADIIINGTEKMSFIIENLLEFSRLQNNKEITLEKVDIEDVIKQISTNFEYNEDTIKPQITIDKIPPLTTNKALISILLKNLIENGIKYNKSDQPQINVSYKQLKGQNVLAVRDNGIGISPKHQREIFQMFRRLHTKEEYEGYGMGLAICQKIAQLLGAKINVTSQVNQGSTFELLIPT